MPIAEADATASFTNFLPSVPKMMDQLKFGNNQLCTISDHTITGSTSQEKDKRQELVASTVNEVQEYCDGLLQQIVDSSSATISTTYGNQKRSDNICAKGIDLNKTPEQKAPQKRKHRPKVIVEGKPKRTTKSETQKTKLKENPHKKRKYVRKSAVTPQTDVIEESVDSTVSIKKSCRRALDFDLEHSKYESQGEKGCHQEIRHTIEKAFNTTSDHKATEMLGGANITYDTNSALLISSGNEITTENLPKNTDDNPLLHKKQTDNFQSERKSNTAMSAITEEPQITKFPVTEEVPAQGNSHLNQEGNNRFMQQYIHYAKEIDNILYQSETWFENSQETGERICQNTLQLVPNILFDSVEAKGSKRKYCKGTENKRDSATNSFDTSSCQKTLQGDGNFKVATPAKDAIRKQKTENRRNEKVSGRSPRKKTSKENTQDARKKDKKRFLTQSNKEMPDIYIKNNIFVEKQNSRASSGERFAASGNVLY